MGLGRAASQLTVPIALTLAACRGTNPGAVAAEVGTAAALEVASQALQRASAPPETSHLAADLNDPTPSRAATLDVEHTRASLLEVNLGACWPTGERRAPRAVQVTFRGDGTVTRVAVVPPRSAATFDQECVARALKDIIVDPFLGPDVVVSVTYGE